MLAEAVVAGADKLKGFQSGKISPSIVSPCATRTYKNWKKEREPATGVELLRMNDGHYQEQEMVDDLVRAGFKINRWRDREGKSISLHIAGIMVCHIDGTIYVENKWHLLECKAMSLDRYTKFKQRGFDAEPGIRSQVQPYLISDELQSEGVDSGFIYSKHKDTCRPFDLYFELDKSYANSLVEQVRKLLEGWTPKPERCSLCPACRFKLECWGAEVIDFTGVHTASLPEMVAQWKTGTAHRQFGKELVEEARAAFEIELGDKPVVFIDDLKCLRVTPTRGGISEAKFVEKYGAAALAGVWEERKIPQMRVQEVEL